MTRVPTVSCSVVSGSVDQNILKCLESLAPQDSRVQGVRVEVTAIVNNGSRELASVVGHVADRVIVREEPYGFAANHNEVLRSTTAEFHLIANDDVVVPRGVISSLVAMLSRPDNEDVAVVSPQLVNSDGTLQPSTYSFPTIPTTLLGMWGVRQRLGEGLLMAAIARLARPRPGSSRIWSHDKTVRVDTLRGAFTLVRTACIRDVGLMDEVSLVGGEETEWHARMHERGWSVLFDPDVSVTHIGGVSTKGRIDLEVEYLKGTVNYFARHRGRVAYEFMRGMALARAQYLRWLYRRRTGDALRDTGASLAAIPYQPQRSRMQCVG